MPYYLYGVESTMEKKGTSDPFIEAGVSIKCFSIESRGPLLFYYSHRILGTQDNAALTISFQLTVMSRMNGELSGHRIVGAPAFRG